MEQDGAWWLLQVCLVAALACWIWRRLSNGDRSGLPPGPNMLQALTSFALQMNKYKLCQHKGIQILGKKYGGLFTIPGWDKTFVIINDWKIMKEALVGQMEVFSGRPYMYVGHQMFAGKAILFADGPALMEQRRYVMHQLKNFGFGRVSRTESIILNQTSKLMDLIELRSGDGGQLPINALFFMPVLNVLFGIIAGKQYDYDDEKIKQFEQILRDMFVAFYSIIDMNFYPWLRFLPSNAKILRTFLSRLDDAKKFMNDEVDSHLESLDIDAEQTDFMGVYLTEMHKRQAKSAKPEVRTDHTYSRDHLVGIALDIIDAGLHTTLASMEWALLYMALWPEIQQRVQDELDRVVGNGRLPAYGDHTLMPYLEATILEIHRYTTVIPMSVPHSTMTATKLAGFSIPQRTIVLQNIWAVHYDPDLWGDPEVFRPERFINAEGKIEKPAYFIPFSIGARKCIGESMARIELFLFMACLLQRFTFSYATGEAPPPFLPGRLDFKGLGNFSLFVRRRHQI